MKFKIKYNIKVCSPIKDIVLPAKIIKAGEPFKLVDAYIEDGFAVIGIKTRKGIQEALFKGMDGTAVNTKKELKSFIDSNFIPLIDGAKHTYIYYDGSAKKETFTGV